MSDHLFQSTVAIIFGQILVLVIRGLDYCVKSSWSHPKDSQWGSGLDSVVANPCVKIMSHAPWATLSQYETNESWHCHLGILPCHQGRKKSTDGQTSLRTGTSKKNRISWKSSVFFVTHFRKWNPYIILLYYIHYS